MPIRMNARESMKLSSERQNQIAEDLELVTPQFCNRELHILGLKLSSQGLGIAKETHVSLLYVS